MVPSMDSDVVEPQPEVVQVWFPMSGGPAHAVGVGAEVIAPDQVRLVFPPWAALNAAKGDIYRVQRDDDGQPWIQEKLEASGFCAIRVELGDDSRIGSLNAGVDAVLKMFRPLGVTGVGMFGLAVLDVPPAADLVRVRHLLDDGRQEGWWEYVELCVTDRWKLATPR
jgi:hypothetical protein